MDFKNLVNSSGNKNCAYTNLTKSEVILVNVKKLLSYYEEPLIKEKMKTDSQKCVQDAFEKFNDFFLNYPTLAKMISENPYNFDMNRLLEMLQLKDRVSEKKISYQDASTGLGFKYYDEYVKPNISSDSK